MFQKNNNYFIFPHIITVILLIVSYIHFGHQLDVIKESLKSTVNSRADFFYQHLQLLSSKNTAMKKTIEYNYVNAKSGLLRSDHLKNIKYYKKEKIYAIAPLDDNISSDLQGTLTLREGLNFSDEMVAELTAILSIDPQLGTINTHVPSSIWSYYTSKVGYMYLSPAHKIQDFQFTNELYEKPFWSEAEPKANKEKRQIISELYDDAAGQGLMLTISDPVILDGEFRGVISLDLGIEKLKSFLDIDEGAIGDTYLIDENKQLNASSLKFKLGDTIDIKSFDTNGQWKKDGDIFYFSVPVLKNELYLVHKISKFSLYKAAFFSSLIISGMLFTILVVVYFSYFLYQSAKRNKKLMQIDPLTKLYNRRGFYHLLEPMYSYLKRMEKKCSVIVIDIDFFKKVNDNYGHKIGDEVIQSIAHILKIVNRKDTLCARWGGEEFLIFIPETNKEQVLKVTQRIHTKVNSTKHSTKSLDITVSIGVCTDIVDDGFESLFAKADEALYKSKETGRDKTTMYSDIKGKN